MNIALSDDQRMIRDAAAQFLADASAQPAVRAAMESESGHDPALWHGIAEMGWCGTAVPEALGGLGLGPRELVLIFEQMGRHLACAPFFATVALAANLLAEAGSAVAKKQYLPQLAQGKLRATAAFEATRLRVRRAGGGWFASGTVPDVVDGASAELILLAGAGGVFAVRGDAKGLKRKPLPTWDGTRRRADLALNNAAVARVDDPRAGGRVARAMALARLCLAAEQLGGAQQCLDITVRYGSERRQFGRPIASFQALKHRCAQMMVMIEGLRSLVYGAAASGDALDAAAAKALASDTYFHCAGEAIQMHGGVGFTWEFEPQLHFKRAQAGSHLLGTASALREQIADAVAA